MTNETPVRAGLNLPNRQWDPYSPRELAALNDLQPQVLVFLAYGSRIDHTHADQLAPYLLTHRTTRVLVRAFDTTISQRDPRAWAQECLRRILTLGHPGNFIVPVELIPWNEPNLEWSAHVTDWTFQVRFASHFALAWQQLARGIPLHLPALSPSTAYADGLAAYASNGLAALYDVVDAHIYGDDPLWPQAYTTGSKPISVTELNQIDPQTFFQAQRGKIREACWFLLGGTADQSRYDLLTQPPFYQSFHEYQEVSLMPVPEPRHPFIVGAGILAKMTAEGDTPTSSEVYVKDGRGIDQYSEATGTKGRYTYVTAENVTHFLPFQS